MAKGLHRLFFEEGQRQVVKQRWRSFCCPLVLNLTAEVASVSFLPFANIVKQFPHSKSLPAIREAELPSSFVCWFRRPGSLKRSSVDHPLLPSTTTQTRLRCDNDPTMNRLFSKARIHDWGRTLAWMSTWYHLPTFSPRSTPDHQSSRDYSARRCRHLCLRRTFV